MFWGLMLDDGKRYTQVVDHSFLVTMAALEPSHPPGTEVNPYVSVMIEYNKIEYMLCTLQHGKCLQCSLNLHITEGEEITFFFEGRGTVHMTGYLITDEENETRQFDELPMLDEENEVGSDQDSDDSVEESADRERRFAGKEVVKSSSDEDDTTRKTDSRARPKKRPVSKQPTVVTEESTKKKKVKLAEPEPASSTSSDKTDSDETETAAIRLQNGKSTDDKSAKKDTQPPQAEDGGGEMLTSTLDKTKATVKRKRKLASGVIVRDLNVGEGAVAKHNRRVSVFYRGWLPQKGNREFDSCTTGKPFTFTLGKGDVIKGWDEGVKGMRLRGKRRISIPPKLAYGKKGVDKVIPPNSPLVFEIEVVKIVE